jgi:hypothetical protein
MANPTLERHGDSFLLVWAEHGIGFGIDRLKDTSDGLKAELTVEGIAPDARGRLLGPVNLNLLSSESQTRLANALAKRVNGLTSDLWHAMVIRACSMVSAQWRAPAPTIDLATIDDIEEVPYLIPGLIPTGETTVLYGDGESAKSLLALRIAYSVAHHTPLPWGSWPTTPGAVLYLDWETNPKTVALRLRRIALAEVQAPPAIHYRQCFRALHDELPSIREEISKKDVALVIVDSIGFAASGALVEDETARTAMNALRSMSPATRLVVAHVSREAAQQAKGKVKPFGSAFFWNAMRSGIEVRRAEDDPNPDVMHLGLYHWKANDGEHHRPIAMSVAFEGRRGSIDFQAADIQEVPDLAARTSISSRLYEILRRGQADTKTLATELDEAEATVAKTLKRMSSVVQIEPGGGRGRPAIWGIPS